jgi:hypothetical protein
VILPVILVLSKAPLSVWSKKLFTIVPFGNGFVLSGASVVISTKTGPAAARAGYRAVRVGPTPTTWTVPAWRQRPCPAWSPARRPLRASTACLHRAAWPRVVCDYGEMILRRDRACGPGLPVWAGERATFRRTGAKASGTWLGLGYFRQRFQRNGLWLVALP